MCCGKKKFLGQKLQEICREKCEIWENYYLNIGSGKGN